MKMLLSAVLALFAAGATFAADNKTPPSPGPGNPCLIEKGANGTDTTPPSPGPGNPCLIRKGSGVEGLIERGPLQPVARPGQKDTAPVAGAIIVVRNQKGREVARVFSDKNGLYEINLKPGKYKLVVVWPRSGISPSPWSKQIEVKNGQWQNLKIKLDTGIRTNVRPNGRANLPGPVQHNVSFTQLPATLTLKVGEDIVFTNVRKFEGWKVSTNDTNVRPLVRQLPQRIEPPLLRAERAGSGTMEVSYRLHRNGPVHTHKIAITVQP